MQIKDNNTGLQVNSDIKLRRETFNKDESHFHGPATTLPQLFFCEEKRDFITQRKDYNSEQSYAQQQLELQNAKPPNVMFAVPTT